MHYWLGMGQSLRRRRLLHSRLNLAFCLMLLLAVTKILGRKDSNFMEGQSLRRSVPYEEDIREIRCEEMNSVSALLPEFVDIPFEDAVRDDHLVGWEDDWVAFGSLPYMEQGTTLSRDRFDVVSTWVNGTSEEFQRIRHQYALQSPLNLPGSMWAESSKARHREWSQIQWALWSSAQNVEDINKIQLITSHDQIPNFPDLDNDHRRRLEEILEIVPDRILFPERFYECTIPTFNSVPIEVNMGSTTSSSDKFLYICDDMLLTKRFRAGDIYTPLYGISMALYDGLVWNSDTMDEFDASRPFQGEYPEYRYSSWHFNRAFGKRNRAYVRHATKVYSRKLLREVAEAFPRAYHDTSRSKFRGDSDVINPHFHFYHYIIERHRKALLWSFFSLRSDLDDDGLLSVSERTRMIAEISAGDDYLADRQTLRLMRRDLQSVGLAPANSVRPRWSSFDGPPYSWYQESTIANDPEYHRPWDAVPDKPELEYECHIDLAHCLRLPADMDDAAIQMKIPDILKRVSKEIPHCGDCIINKLIKASGPKGLRAFLPEESFATKRDLAIKAIMRYSYTKNKLPGSMIQLGATQYDLDLLKYRLDVYRGGWEAMPSEICVNDDVPMGTSDEQIGEIKTVLSQFYRELTSGRREHRDEQEQPKVPVRADYEGHEGHNGHDTDTEDVDFERRA